jgi:hypothetical protein
MEGECLIWTGRVDRDGLPRSDFRGKRNCLVRRIVYQLSRADIPNEMSIVMKCRNKNCVLVSHMQLLTKNALKVRLANSAANGDRSGARLHPECRLRGESHGSSKLTTDDVIEIRLRYAQKAVTQCELAAEYGITQTAISHIIRRKTWAHVPDPEESSDA